MKLTLIDDPQAVRRLENLGFTVAINEAPDHAGSLTKLWGLILQYKWNRRSAEMFVVATTGLLV
jgi:hypothetical protein